MDLESRVQELGRQLLARARASGGGGGGVWFARRRDGALIDRLMSHEDLRVRLLRFVDVLPAVLDDEALVSHLDEYLGDVEWPADLPVWHGLPRAAAWGLRRARRGVAAHALARAGRAVAQRMAGRFIAGRDADQITRTVQRLHRRGMGFTLDLLGEATVTEAEAAAYQRQYLDLLDELPGRVAPWPARQPIETINGRVAPRLNLSVKVSSLYSQIDPIDEAGGVEAIKTRLRSIFLAARRGGAFINVDMEQYDTKNITLRVFRELLDEPELRDWPDVGIAMQAYLRDTESDLREMLEWARHRGAPVTVRLVRGAYWDYENIVARQNGWPIPVWTAKADTDASYERCLKLLIENHPAVEAAIATHNVRSLALGMALTERAGLDATQYEFQMLYGMADPLKEALLDMGRRLRVYVPFGELIPGMAYLVRRLLENSSNQSFLKMGMSDDVPAEVVLAAPVVSIREDASGSDSRLRLGGGNPEPVRRFVDVSERETFAATIERVRSRLGGEYRLIIGGNEHDGGMVTDSTNPARPREVVGRVASATAAQAGETINAAARASRDWAGRTMAHRADIMRRAAGIMRDRRDELAAWEIFEAGKPWREADADVCEAIDFLAYYADEAERLAKGMHVSVAGETNDYIYGPRGVAAVIAPWNFPLAIPCGMTAAALVTGNTVVLKPAPQTPVIASMLVSILLEAGVPGGAINFLPGPDEVGEALVNHPGVNLIAFTGSETVGKLIYETAAHVRPGQQHLKRVIAEMGGKNAIIIDADADVDDAVRGTVASAFGYAGQKCSAASRVIVVGDLYESFVERVAQAAASLRIGLPEHPGTFVGPVIDKQAYDRIAAAIEGTQGHARLVAQASLPDLDGGYVISPTVFADVDPQSKLAQEEIFGPVLAVMRARDFEHALELANSTRFALTGGVYSRSPANLELARRQFRVGNLYLNRKITGAIVGRQPFGGMKMSGVGSKAGGPDYLLQFVEPRTITENTLRRGFAPSEESAGE